jgi:thermitase
LSEHDLKKGVFLIGLIAMSMMFFSGNSDYSITGKAVQMDSSYSTIPGEIIVKRRPIVGTLSSGQSLNSYLKSIGAKRESAIKSKMPLVLSATSTLEKITVSQDTDEVLEVLKSMPEVEYAQPNYLYFVKLNDPSLERQYAHLLTETSKAWDTTRGSEDVVIAVIDSGVDYEHEDLANNIWKNNGVPGFDFVNFGASQAEARALIESYGYGTVDDEDYAIPDGDPSDYNGHGTHVAGIAAAVGDNGVGGAGACPKCKIMPLRAGFTVVHPSYGEVGTLDSTSIYNAIQYAIVHDADIISMSYGLEGEDKMQKDALQQAYDAGIVLVAASGNSDMDAAGFFPASFEPAITVSATDRYNLKADFSNYGSTVDISAPGVEIFSTVPRTGTISDPTGYKTIQGTSMATPYVSGVAGLLLSMDPTLKPFNVDRILKLNSDTAPENMGDGVVNARKAVEYLKPVVNPCSNGNCADYIIFNFTSNLDYSNSNGQRINGLGYQVMKGLSPKEAKAIVTLHDRETNEDKRLVSQINNLDTFNWYEGEFPSAGVNGDFSVYTSLLMIGDDVSGIPYSDNLEPTMINLKKHENVDAKSCGRSFYGMIHTKGDGSYLDTLRVEKGCKINDNSFSVEAEFNIQSYPEIGEYYPIAQQHTLYGEGWVLEIDSEGYVWFSLVDKNLKGYSVATISQVPISENWWSGDNKLKVDVDYSSNLIKMTLNGETEEFELGDIGRINPDAWLMGGQSVKNEGGKLRLSQIHGFVRMLKVSQNVPR